jgi:agmatinase
MREVEERGVGPVVEDAVAAAAAGTDAVYVTFDIDAVDPSVAPGTGTPEPGGLSAAQALTVVETLGAHDAVGAVDLMEVAPDFDDSEGTQRLAAYLLVTLLERQFAE